MKLVSINTDLLEKYRGDKEVLLKSQRPYVLIIHLKYKNKSQDFAVPIRSNIPAAAPKQQYFALPPRPTTRPHNRHGLHYIIISECQAYPNDYATGKHPNYSTNINYLLSKL